MKTIMTENIFDDRPNKNEKLESIDYVKTLIEKARDESRESDIPKLEKLIRLLNSKKYGLVWEEHTEKVEEEMKTKIPVFIENQEKKINGNLDSEIFNFLLEGDNLHSLHLLEKTHLGKIDVIYIDPPYNTGKKDGKFKYNDDFVDSKDSFIHSKWLSFMERRLKIAKNLLADDGLICISIDDNEQAQLKILMDEIFGYENVQSIHHIQVRYENKSLNEDNDWQPVMEYVLIYSKNKQKFKANKPREDYDLSKFQYEITELTSGTEIFIGNKKVTIFKDGEWKIEKKQGAIGLLKETWASGSIVRQSGTAAEFLSKYLIQRKNEDGLNVLYKIDNMGEDGLGYRYVSGPKKQDAIRGKFYTGVPLSRKQELENGGKSEKTRPIPNYYNFSGEFGNIRHEGGVPFNGGKKPVKLISQLVNYHTNKNVTVLDFFAGSGSTGHAVLELNKQDGGNRKFILATNDEVVETTYERMQNINNDLSLNLKYFKTDFVIKEDFPDVSLEYELLKYVTPLVELEYAVDITNPKVQIVLNEEQLESLIDNEQLISNSTIFMHPDVFRDDKQKQILQDLQIRVQEIPNYFFGTELWAK